MPNLLMRSSLPRLLLSFGDVLIAVVTITQPLLRWRTVIPVLIAMTGSSLKGLIHLATGILNYYLNSTNSVMQAWEGHPLICYVHLPQSYGGYAPRTNVTNISCPQRQGLCSRSVTVNHAFTAEDRDVRRTTLLITTVIRKTTISIHRKKGL